MYICTRIHLSYRNAALLDHVKIIKPTRGREERIKEGEIKGGGTGKGELEKEGLKGLFLC